MKRPINWTLVVMFIIAVYLCIAIGMNLTRQIAIDHHNLNCPIHSPTSEYQDRFDNWRCPKCSTIFESQKHHIECPKCSYDIYK